jgi:hypothetical protein
MQVAPIIAGATALFNFFANKDREQKNRDQARKQYDDYYQSPYVKALNGYIRQLWAEQGLDAKFGNQPGLLDSLLTPAPFDFRNPKYKIPGAGLKLGNAALDILASLYDPDKDGPLAKGKKVKSKKSTASVPGETVRIAPGDDGMYGASGLLDLPPSPPSAPPALLPSGKNYGPAVSSAFGGGGGGGGASAPMANADPYSADSILEQLLGRGYLNNGTRVKTPWDLRPPIGAVQGL